MNTREVGNKYEDLACKVLENKGLRIIERNYRCKIGEIDIIARDENEDSLVFVEVKYRKTANFGGADFAVDYKKQNKIRKVAETFMKHHKISPLTFCRFDCIMITGEDVKHIKNAFGGL